MDMSFIRTFYDGFKEKYPSVELLGTFYNLEDLLASKDSGASNIDGRLEFLSKQVLSRMIQDQIIIWEPFYEIIKENYPDIKIGRTLYDRINRDYLPNIEEIRIHGKNVNPDLKAAVVKYSEENQAKKVKQIMDFIKYSKVFRKQIIEEGNDPAELSHWIEKTKILLKNVIHKYATTGNYVISPYLAKVSSKTNKHHIIHK
ncbi:MAG: hypothetical protein J5I91_05560 [Bacteroidetes bacterium]|nr:hypothetical protein [Bacteroidota bacterium]